MVIVITGPIASGKSTVARELARELERTQVRVSVIDLDILHDMLVGDGPASDDATWALAHHAAATQVNTFLANGVSVVVVDELVRKAHPPPRFVHREARNGAGEPGRRLDMSAAAVAAASASRLRETARS
jgi:AAA domain